MEDLHIKNTENFLMAKFFRFLNYEIAIPTLVLLIFNMLVLNEIYVPFHDTFYMFTNFHYFYSEFYFHGDIAQWMLYGMYGAPSHFFQLTFLSPSNYLLAVIGYLLNIKDVLLLFKISVILDQIFFLLGVYLLSRLIYVKKTTIFVACLGAACSTVWFYQIFWNFHIYYLLPLNIYFLISYFKYNRPEAIWLTGITTIISLLGNGAYFIVIYFIIYVIIFSVFLWKEKSKWKLVFTFSICNTFFFLLFAFIVSAYFYFAFNSFDFITVFSPERKRDLGVSLLTFLTYCNEVIGSFHFPEFISGWIYQNTKDITVYIGLLPILFLIWAFIKVRETSFIAISAATISIICLSFGGGFAILFYYFPGFSEFRHLGHLYGTIKILILISSCFGIDYFLSKIEENNYFYSLRENRFCKIRFTFINILIIIFIILFFLDYFISYNLHCKIENLSDPNSIVNIIVFCIRTISYLIGFFLFYYIVRCNKYSNRRISQISKTILIICFAIDLISFQVVVLKNTPKLPDYLLYSLQTINANQFVYQEQRNNNALYARQQQALDLIQRDNKIIQPNVHYGNSYNFVQLDPISPPSDYRNTLISTGVDLFMRIKGGYPNNFAFYLPQDDKSLLNVLGANSTKIRLISNAIFTNNADEAFAILHQTKDLNNVVILRKEVKKPVYTIDVIKKMVSADSSDIDTGPENIFLATSDNFWETNKPYPHWVQFDFGVPKVITNYSIGIAKAYAIDWTSKLPKKWSFLASNDEHSWKVLDKRENQIDWNGNRTFVVNNSDPFRYYRLYFTEGMDPNLLRIYQILFKGEENAAENFTKSEESKIDILKFSSNEIEFKVFNPTNKNTWLVYSDAFHPGWNATVNGHETPLLEANLAFKAIEIKQGNNIVRFTFDNGLMSKISVLLALTCISFSIIALVKFIKLLFTRKELNKEIRYIDYLLSNIMFIIFSFISIVLMILFFSYYKFIVIPGKLAELYKNTVFILPQDKAEINKDSVHLFNTEITTKNMKECFYLNGKNSYIDTSLMLNDLNNFNIMFSIKPSKLQTSNLETILDNGHTKTDNMCLQTANFDDNTYTLHCFGSDIIFKLLPDVWTNIFIKIDLNDKSFSIYVNGEKQTSKLPANCKFGSGSLIFGRLANSETRYFKGSISNVKVWDKLLTESEIQMLISNEGLRR